MFNQIRFFERRLSLLLSRMRLFCSLTEKHRFQSVGHGVVGVKDVEQARARREREVIWEWLAFRADSCEHTWRKYMITVVVVTLNIG